MTEPRHSSTVPRHLSEQAPLSRHFKDDLDEGQIKEMWQRVDHAPAGSRRPWVWALVAAAAVLLLGIGLFRAERGAEPRQLALLSGSAPTVLSTDDRPSAPRFDDGSQVSLSAGTRLEVLRNDARSFVTALRRGGVTFDVKPGGPRHWVIEAGELSVEVVGTRFRVERGLEVTRVSVEHGIVMVRGERVPGGSVRLTAGKSFALPAPTDARTETRVAPSAEGTKPSLPPPVMASANSEKAPSVPSLASAEPEARDEVERSLQAADAARQRSDNAAAIRYFDAALRQAAPGDARRGLAALSLARLVIAGDPAKAAAILRSSLPDMPQALLEDALVRLVEGESRAGNRDAAAKAAADYLRRFPAGRRADEVRRWSEP